MDKFLKVIFLLLFLVLLGEVGYLFYSSRSPKIPSTPTAPPIVAPFNCNQIQRPGTTQYVLADNIKSLSEISLGKTEKLWMTLEEPGTISNLQYNVVDNGHQYNYSFSVVDSNGEILQTYYFNDQNKVTIYKVDKSGNKQVTDWKSIKNGESVVYYEFDDLKENINQPLHNKIEIDIMP